MSQVCIQIILYQVLINNYNYYSFTNNFNFFYIIGGVFVYVTFLVNMLEDIYFCDRSKYDWYYDSIFLE